MRWNVGLITEWIFDNDTDSYMARAAIDHAKQGNYFMDVSGTPSNEMIPSENVALVECFVDNLTYVAMTVDLNMTIVWSNQDE